MRTLPPPLILQLKDANGGHTIAPGHDMGMFCGQLLVLALLEGSNARLQRCEHICMRACCAAHQLKEDPISEDPEVHLQVA